VVVIEARLDTFSAPLKFILDTGCGGISLDSATCASLKITTRLTDTTITGIAGRKRVNYIFNHTLHVGDMSADSLNFYINDYSGLTAVYGEKVDGIIGYSFLRRYIVNVNFDTARIRIYRPGKMVYGIGGTVLTPQFNYLPIEYISVSDNRKISFPFYMDSGAGLSLLLSEQFAKDSNMILSRRRPVLIQAEGLGGVKNMLLTVVKQLRIGPYRFTNVPTYIYADTMNITAYPYTGGLLGNDIMRRFNITYNYPRNEIHIIPNTHFNDDFDYAYTGITLYGQNDSVFVEDIIPGSPAELGGLRVEDEIIGINKTFTGKIMDYTNLLQKVKEQVDILIRRDKKLQVLTIEPESILR
jgi:hypothetical protein